jgi:alpha-1,2-mannosyltransferase
MTAPSGARLPRWRLSRRSALIAACWLLALTVVGYFCYHGPSGPMIDLQVYLAGSTAVRHGSTLYGVVTQAGLPFTYPPLGAILAIPLGLVPYSAAKVAWDGMICVPLAVAVWFGFRPLLARAGRAAPAVFAVALACCAPLLPVRQEFYFGQVDLFLVAICLLDCATTRPRWPRGLLIGLATAIKLEPGVFIIYLLITGRRKDAAVATASFAGWTALAWLIDPRDSLSYWTSEIFQTNRLGGNGSVANQSLRGMILRAFNPHHAPPAVWLVVALVVAVAGFAAARSSWRRGNDMAGIAITGLLAASISPVAWIHHYCWVVVALGVIVGDGRSRRRVAAAVVGFALFVSLLPLWAQSLINSGRLGMLPGRELEDAFGVAALVLMVIIYRIRPTDGELRAQAPPSEDPRQADLLGAGSAQQLPSGAG